MLKKDFHFFDVAKAVSKIDREFPKNRYKIGAIITDKNKIISVGYNQQKTNPIQKKYNKFRPYIVYNPYIHAEIHAILNSKKDSLKGCSIYTYRETKDGKISNSRPCEACMELIKKMGIKKICYTTKDGYCIEYIKEEDT